VELLAPGYADTEIRQQQWQGLAMSEPRQSARNERRGRPVAGGFVTPSPRWAVGEKGLGGDPETH
jgi:hypothetical protein